MNQTLDFSVAIQAAEAAGMFTFSVDILRYSQATSTIGQVDLTDYTVHYSALPCRFAPLVDFKPNPNFESKDIRQVDQENEFHLLIDGYYTDIEQREGARINGVIYEILNVENDSAETMTRMAIRSYSL